MALASGCDMLFAFAWCAHSLPRLSLWRDEVDAIYFALGDLQNTLSMFVNAGQNGALYFLALRAWLRLAGSSEFALRYPAVLFGKLLVPLVWQVARHADAGYQRAIDVARQRGIKIPMAPQ